MEKSSPEGLDQWHEQEGCWCLDDGGISKIDVQGRERERERENERDRG